MRQWLRSWYSDGDDDDDGGDTDGAADCWARRRRATYPRVTPARGTPRSRVSTFCRRAGRDFSLAIIASLRL